MTGSELIWIIQSNHLEDYDFVVSHDTGESAHSIQEFEIIEDSKEVELY